MRLVRVAGFTLLEVMVALTIVAIALSAMIAAAGKNSADVAYLRDKTFAHWVALNQISEMQARQKYPASEVNYFVADVLDLPREWRGRFDLVVESLTVQSMPPEQHTIAAQNIAALVAPEGTLLVLATTRDERLDVKGPPWPLTRAELEDFASGDLVLRRVERIESGAWWRAELSRRGTGRAVPRPNH